MRALVKIPSREELGCLYTELDMSSLCACRLCVHVAVEPDHDVAVEPDDMQLWSSASKKIPQFKPKKHGPNSAIKVF